MSASTTICAVHSELPAEAAYQYDLSGLRLQSNVPFAVTRASTPRSPDIRFNLRVPSRGTQIIFSGRCLIGQIRNGAGYPSISVYRFDDGFVLDCHNTQRAVKFVISRNVRRIDCYPQAGATMEDIEIWLFGLVWSFVLQHHEIFSLHSAAVNCRGRAVAFLGQNGYGKTTTAFFFLQRGHSLITDDVLAIAERNGLPFALPGCPSMNLWERTLSQLRGCTGLSHDEPSTGKQRYSVEALQVRFCKSDVLLGNIYLLYPADPQAVKEVQIVPVSRSRAMMELLYYTRANSLIKLPKQGSLLKVYSRLVSKVPVRHLVYPAGFEFLPAVYEAILRDISHSSPLYSRHGEKSPQTFGSVLTAETQSSQS